MFECSSWQWLDKSDPDGWVHKGNSRDSFVSSATQIMRSSHYGQLKTWTLCSIRTCQISDGHSHSRRDFPKPGLGWRFWWASRSPDLEEYRSGKLVISTSTFGTCFAPRTSPSVVVSHSVVLVMTTWKFNSRLIDLTMYMDRRDISVQSRYPEQASRVATALFKSVGICTTARYPLAWSTRPELLRTRLALSSS